MTDYYDETGYDGGYTQEGYDDNYAETVQDGYAETVHDGYSEVASLAPTVAEEAGASYYDGTAGHDDDYAVGYEDVLGGHGHDANGDDEHSKAALAEGWEAQYDENMKSYYYLNSSTGEATWVRPEAPIEEEEEEEEEVYEGGGVGGRVEVHGGDEYQEGGEGDETWVEGGGDPEGGVEGEGEWGEYDEGASPGEAAAGSAGSGDQGGDKSRLMKETNAFTYDEISRTWNPHHYAAQKQQQKQQQQAQPSSARSSYSTSSYNTSSSSSSSSSRNSSSYAGASSSVGEESSMMMMSTMRGSLFASLRPRVTPVVVKALPPKPLGSQTQTGLRGQGGSSSLDDEQDRLKEASQEERRLRVFQRHLENHAKSKMTALTTVSENGSGSGLGGGWGPNSRPVPPGAPGSVVPTLQQQKQQQEKQERQQERAAKAQAQKAKKHAKMLPPHMQGAAARASIGGSGGGGGGPGPVVGPRLSTPEKLEAVKNLVTGELDKAREELERAKAFHAARARLTASSKKLDKEKNKKNKLASAAVEKSGVGGTVDPEVWSSTNWSIGPKGYVHPPAAESVGDFDAMGERALEAAWHKRRLPPPAEANRFALGVPDPPIRFGPPKTLSPLRQRFSEDMDHHALLCLHYHTAGNGWIHRKGWDDELHGKRPPGSHVSWYGVHTLSTQVHRVVNIVVPKNNLKGPLIDEVRWLDKLKTLALPSNELSGSIPPAWSTLTSLTMLDLSNNHITGPLPARFLEGMKRNRDKREGGNNGLRSLNLSNNKLWGEVPYTVSTLVGLTTLNLSSNTLSQQLPEGLLSCTSLKTLRLSFNKLTGPLPADLSRLQHLVIIEAAGNELEGDIPALPPRLMKLHLQGNRLEHDLPPSFFQITSLADVNLSDNYLSGAVSDDVVNLKALRVFMLTGNRHSAQDKAVITDSLKVYLPNLVRQQGFRI